jgi:hypothetical protein
LYKTTLLDFNHFLRVLCFRNWFCLHLDINSWKHSLLDPQEELFSEKFCYSCCCKSWSLPLCWQGNSGYTWMWLPSLELV